MKTVAFLYILPHDIGFLLGGSNIFLLDETQVGDFAGDVAGMVARVVFGGFLGTHGGQQEDRALEFGRAGTIGQDNLLVVIGPVGGRRNGLLVGQLQRLDAAHNLVHGTAHAGRVVERQHEFVFGVDDKDGANREWQCLFIARCGVDHAVGCTDFAIGVADNGKFDLDLVLTVCHDILQPVLVRFDGVDA